MNTINLFILPYLAQLNFISPSTSFPFVPTIHVVFHPPPATCHVQFPRRTWPACVACVAWVLVVTVDSRGAISLSGVPSPSKSCVESLGGGVGWNTGAKRRRGREVHEGLFGVGKAMYHAVGLVLGAGLVSVLAW